MVTPLLACTVVATMCPCAVVVIAPPSIIRLIRLIWYQLRVWVRRGAILCLLCIIVVLLGHGIRSR